MRVEHTFTKVQDVSTFATCGCHRTRARQRPAHRHREDSGDSPGQRGARECRGPRHHWVSFNFFRPPQTQNGPCLPPTVSVRRHPYTRLACTMSLRPSHLQVVFSQNLLTHNTAMTQLEVSCRTKRSNLDTSTKLRGTGDFIPMASHTSECNFGTLPF